MLPSSVDPANGDINKAPAAHGENTVNIKLKRILKTTGLLAAMVAVYVGTAAWYMWKWEKPHSPLPAAHLEQTDQRIFSEAQTELATAANNAMVELAEELQTVSLSGAIAIDGELTWAGSTGLANVENEVPASVESRYRIGSVSKSLTAIALARMVELEMLSLDDHVQAFLPDYPRYETPMTVRQLAGHMSGIRHYEMNLFEFPPHDTYLDANFEDVLDATEVFSSDDLKFAPGQGFQYSTYGYTLLSAIMQQAAGKPFLDLMQELVFDPLGMDATSAELPGGVDNLVEFYNSDNGEFSITRDVDLSIKWAGGGLVSTPSDLVTLGAALLNDQLIQPETRQEFFSVQPMFDGSDNPQAYALGWRHHETINILGEDKPVDVVHHGGTSVGGVAFLLLVPDHNISIAFLANGAGNRTRGELQMLAYSLARMAITKSWAHPQ